MISFLIPFLCVTAPNLFKASNVFASVETVPAHNILGVVVACCRYYKVLWSCTPHLSSWNHTKNWAFFDAWTHCSWDFKSHIMMSPRTYVHYFTFSWVELQESFIQPVYKCIQILLEWYCTICIHYCCPGLGTNIKKRYAPYWPAGNSTGDLYAFWATSSNINLYISVM